MRLNVVKQRDFKDCGVSCLLSIIRHYKGNVPIEQLRIDTYTSKKGTTAYNIISAAKKYGFDAAGYKVDLKTLLEDKMVLPAIAHVNQKGLEHFIVIYKICKDKLIVMDPAVGKKQISLIEFENIFTGVIIKILPKTKITFIQQDYKVFELFFKLIKSEKKLFYSILICNILSVLFTICSSYFFKVGIENLDHLKVIIVMFSVIVAFKCLMAYISKYFENYFNKNLDVYLIRDFLEHLFYLPSKIIESRTVGEIITRVNELNNVKGLFSEFFVSFLLNFLISIIIIPILIHINLKLFLVLLISILIYFLLGFFTSKSIYKKIMHNIDLEDDTNTVLVENINCYQSIKNLNVTDKVLLKIESIYSKYLFDKFCFSKYFANIESIKFSISEINLLIINCLGFSLIYKSQISVADLILFNSLMSFFLEPIKNLINSLPKYYYLKASYTKINEFLSIKKENLIEEKRINAFNLKLDNVCYTYDGYNKVINNFNMEIKQGEKIILTGKSGVGKSTLCKIIAGLEKNNSGNIWLGNYNYKDLQLGNIKNNITYVSQHEYLISDSIKNNILFYREIDGELFEKVIRACLIEQIVSKKELRYETLLTLDSNNLSGGEIQRIILARACLNKFNILILDEALSECDKKLERQIIINLNKIFSNKTIIYISHKNPDDLFERKIKVECDAHKI